MIDEKAVQKLIERAEMRRSAHEAIVKLSQSQVSKAAITELNIFIEELKAICTKK